MSANTTPPLPVKQVIYTSGSSPMLTFILATPYLSELFLGGIVITRTSTGTATDIIVPGTDQAHGGKVSMFVDPTTFADLRAQAIVPFKVVLTYDLSVSDVLRIDIIRNVAALSQDMAEALLAAVQDLSLNRVGEAAE